MNPANDNKNHPIDIVSVFENLLQALTAPPKFEPNKFYSLEEVLQDSGFSAAGDESGIPVFTLVE